MASIMLIGLLGGCGDDRRALQQSTQDASPAVHSPVEQHPQTPVPEPELLALDRPLAEEALIAAVLARNPTLMAMQDSYLAAQARYPQESAIPEPTLSYELAPLSLHQSTPGMGVTVSQPIPWSRKRRGRGDVARAGVDAAAADVSSARLQLVAESQYAFADYWLASGELTVNGQERQIVDRINASAVSAYGAGQGGRVAALQAQSMLNELDHHAILLEHARNIAIARLNLLLHRPSEDPLPAPPEHLPEPVMVPEVPELVRLALEHRPDLALAAARRRQAVAMSSLARAQDLPDVSVSVGYNSMWSDPDMRFTVGVSVPLPVNRDLHGAARDEARDEIHRAEAEVSEANDRMQFEVRQAHERVLESWHIVHLLRERMVPTAQEIVSTAQSGIASGGRDFAALLSAYNELLDMQWQEQQALADFHHRLADLERTIGSPIPLVHGFQQEHP